MNSTEALPIRVAVLRTSNPPVAPEARYTLVLFAEAVFLTVSKKSVSANAPIDTVIIEVPFSNTGIVISFIAAGEAVSTK